MLAFLTANLSTINITCNCASANKYFIVYYFARICLSTIYVTCITVIYINSRITWRVITNIISFVINSSAAISKHSTVCA